MKTYNKVIKTFKSDNGKEYKNKRIFNFCKNKGIHKVFSIPYNPQINGLDERFNRTIVDCTRTLLFTSKLNTKFWDIAIKYATHLYDITPHFSINNRIPNKIFFNNDIDLSKIKVFGCSTYYKILITTKFLNSDQNQEKEIFRY